VCWNVSMIKLKFECWALLCAQKLTRFVLVNLINLTGSEFKIILPVDSYNNLFFKKYHFFPILGPPLLLYYFVALEILLKFSPWIIKREDSNQNIFFIFTLWHLSFWLKLQNNYFLYQVVVITNYGNANYLLIDWRVIRGFN
jgi:hypothetical protein